eukprot:529472_1
MAPIAIRCRRNSTMTEQYGLQSGLNMYTMTEQGRINAITSWGMTDDDVNPDSVNGITWHSDNQTQFTQIGNNGYPYTLKPCQPFILDNDEYINGYEVFSSYDINDVRVTGFIRGLTFFTNKNNVYTCKADDYVFSQGRKNYTGYYLTGFESVFKWYITVIKFQFSSLTEEICYPAPTTSPTLDPLTPAPNYYCTTIDIPKTHNSGYISCNQYEIGNIDENNPVTYHFTVSHIPSTYVTFSLCNSPDWFADYFIYIYDSLQRVMSVCNTYSCDYCSCNEYEWM